MRRMKENSTRVSLEQASEIIKNAKKHIDEKVKAAETEYEKTIFYAKKKKRPESSLGNSTKELEAGRRKLTKEERKRNRR